MLYNYWYAGGLPISKSELECLDLVEFAMREKMKIGVHYCSLENKHTGQIYQQNTRGTIPATGYLSEKDFFIKSAKVFGADIQPVKRVLKQRHTWIFNETAITITWNFTSAKFRRCENWMWKWGFRGTCWKNATTANICARCEST